MKRLIKNYTTTIPVEKTIAEIQSLLGQNGAKGLMIEYDDNGNVKDIFFKIVLNNKELPFRLPAKPDLVYKALHPNLTYGVERRYGQHWREEASRIAWRICKTWLEAQITLINLDQAKIQEVFLPYMVVQKDKTLYEAMEENRFMLPGGNDEQETSS